MLERFLDAVERESDEDSCRDEAPGDLSDYLESEPKRKATAYK